MARKKAEAPIEIKHTLEQLDAMEKEIDTHFWALVATRDDAQAGIAKAHEAKRLIMRERLAILEAKNEVRS